MGNSLVTVLAIHGFVAFAKSISFAIISDTSPFGTYFDNSIFIDIVR